MKIENIKSKLIQNSLYMMGNDKHPIETTQRQAHIIVR